MLEKLSDYLKINGAEQPKKVPNSNKITYVHRGNGLPQLYEFDLVTREERPFVLTDGRVLSVNHSKSGMYTVLGIDYKGNEKKQLFLYHQQTKKLKRLVYALDHFHTFGDFSPNEKKIIYTSYQKEEQGYHVHIIDVETEKGDLLFRCEGACTVVKWMKDCDHVVVQLQETNIDSSYWIINLQDLSKVRIGVKDKLARYQSVVFSKNQEKGFLLSDVNSEYMHLYQFSLSHPQELIPVIQSIPWDIEEMKLSKDETKIALTVNQGGVSLIYVYDIANNSLKKMEELPIGVTSHITWLDNRSFFFLLKGPQMPGEVHIYDLLKRTLTRLTDTGYSDALQLRKYNPEMCAFKSFDELEIPYFYYANSKNPKGAVIYVHGGPENLSRVDFNPILQGLVHMGISVFVPNIRGSKGFGRKYLSLDDRRKRLDAAKDIKALAQVAFDKHGIQKDKLGIMGRSYGGFIVNTVIGHYPNLWSAAVSIVGISHIRTFLEKTGSYRRLLREYEYGFLSEDKSFFDEISPLCHAKQVSVPLLMCHGQNDSRVPVEESKQFKEKLTKLGKDVTLIISEEDGHQMGGQTSSMASYQSMQFKVGEFFDRYLN